MKNKLPIVIGATIGAIIALFALPAFAATGCFIGGSAGASASASRLSDETTRIDLGTSSPMAGAEVGCKLAVQGFSLGGLIRYDFLNTRIRIDAESIRQNGRWMALGTIGAPINDSTNIYALGGISGTKFEFADTFSKSSTNWVVGLGISTELLKTGLSLFAEYNAILPKDMTMDATKFRSADHLVRAGVRFGF